MSKLYNSIDEVASEMSDFFKVCVPNISKNTLKTLPYIILGMINSESESLLTLLLQLIQITFLMLNIINL